VSTAHSHQIAGDLVRVLLVEDDHGDAFLVSELLREEGAPVAVHRAQSLAEGLALLASESFDCVLLDLGLPDASGLVALERLREAAPHLPHLVLTGDRDDQRGIDAVAAGAQDYIVKGSLGGDGLRRAIIYAVERRQADSVRQQLRAAEILAEEATRLERGLLPVPILNDPALLVGTGYRPGRERTLLGGDFYDLVHTPDGAVHLMIGDVSGHGADEAALGVCLRVAWRTQTLGGVDVERVLPTLQQVLVHERHAEEIFATVSTVTITADRTSAAVRSAGHPPPMLLGNGDPPTVGPTATGPPLGAFDDSRWPALEMALPPRWGLLLFTDGLIEGRAAVGDGHRLGLDGLIALLADADRTTVWAQDPYSLVARLIDDVLYRNGGAPLDDIAAILLAGRRSPA
jgi:serine phosphatase RsbU (regulator of sigma subunit)